MFPVVFYLCVYHFSTVAGDAFTLLRLDFYIKMFSVERYLSNYSTGLVTGLSHIDLKLIRKFK